MFELYKIAGMMRKSWYKKIRAQTSMNNLPMPHMEEEEIIFSYLYEPHLYLLFLRKDSKEPWKIFNERQPTTHWPQLRCSMNMQRPYRISPSRSHPLSDMNHSHVNTTFYSTICKEQHWSVKTWQGPISWWIGRWWRYAHDHLLSLVGHICMSYVG